MHRGGIKQELCTRTCLTPTLKKKGIKKMQKINRVDASRITQETHRSCKHRWEKKSTSVYSRKN